MRAAFSEIVDYAGLFPPASCSMADAVRQYDLYRRSPDRWMLGRFVVAGIRLEEFGATLESGDVHIDLNDPWRLSVVMGAMVTNELALIDAFSARWSHRGVIADSVEFRVSSVGQALAAGAQIPATLRRHFEVPVAGPYRELVRAFRTVGAFGKIRTGGTSPELFPTAEDLTKFLIASVSERIPFKATAGLHHPFRGNYPLTYAANSQRQLMFGFVNVLVATAELARSGKGETAQAILEDDDLNAFVRSHDAISWRDESYSATELEQAHQQYFLGFGSCSFREPYDELGLDRAA
jgi:hypothetical protein